MQALQTALYRYEGSINKLNVDDKGVTLVAALGLPPLTHEDDAARGVQAALAMQAKLRELGLRCSIGITSGRAFCGEVGNAPRREYTMIGEVVNLAARLMQAAPDDILCDAATYQAAQARLDFDAAAADRWSRARPSRSRSTGPQGEARLVLRLPTAMVGPCASGRAADRRRCRDLLRRQQSGVVVIEGEAGIGKSRLVDEMRPTGRPRWACTVLLGAGDAIERATLVPRLAGRVSASCSAWTRWPETRRRAAPRCWPAGGGPPAGCGWPRCSMPCCRWTCPTTTLTAPDERAGARQITPANCCWASCAARASAEPHWR